MVLEIVGKRKPGNPKALYSHHHDKNGRKWKEIGGKMEGEWKDMQRKLPGNRSDLNRSQAAPPTWGQPSWRVGGCRIGSGFTLWIFARRELEHSHF